MPFDEPRGGNHDEEGGQRHDRPIPCDSRRGVRRQRWAGGPRTEPAERSERQPDEEPKGEATPECTDRGAERDPPPATVGEEVDRADEERQEEGDEDELERPPLNDPVSDPDRAARALGELRPLVQRTEDLLRGSPEKSECLRVHPAGRVAKGLRRAGAAGREGDRGDAVRQERPLLVEGERKAEIDELPEEARGTRPCPATVGDPVCDSGDERGCGRPRPLTRELD